MKSRILSLIVVICMLLSFTSINVFAATTVHTAVSNGVIAKFGSSGFGHANFKETAFSTESNGLGGKASDDVYAKVDANEYTSSDTHFITVDGKDKVRKSAYYVMTLNIYGNSVYFNTYDRIDSSTKPYFTKINASDFKANTWNNITYVYNVAAKTTDTYVNGVLKGTVDMQAATTAIKEGLTYNYITQLRSQVTYKKIFYLDDIMTYSTDTIPADYMPVIKNENITVFEDTSTIGFQGDVFEVETDDTVRVSKDNGATWTETKTVESGDLVALERVSDNGKTYKIYSALSMTGFKNTLATKNSGATYVQGGNPVDAEGNAIASTKVDVSNPHGSGITMELMASGVNNPNSTQTFYQFDWPMAKRATNTKYLVLEANFAIPTKTETLYPASGMSISTNGGNVIGSVISYARVDLQNRINHYMWVYDKENGTYVDYLNGEPLVDAPVEVIADFNTGAKTAVRFTVSGSYIANADALTKTRLYAGYLSDYEIYECFEYEVPQGLKIPGTKRSLLPYVGATVKTSELLNMFAEEDRQYVTIYANRGYTPVTNPNQVLNTGSAIVVTNKDGIFDYARVSYAPSADADFVIDTIQAPADNSVYTVIAYLKDEGNSPRSITFVLARYDESGNMTDVNFTKANMSLGSAVGVKIPAAKAMGDVKLFAIDGFDTLTPVDEYMKIR